LTSTVLAIDPGTGKCGVAVVSKIGGSLHIVYRAVVQADEITDEVKRAMSEYKPDLIVIGAGTNSKSIQMKVRDATPGQALLILDERDTTIRARERYWEHTPRRGWRRLLPSTLQVPPVPIDDFVAVILAERALSVE
jgi:RNase H-fold protein (predicted Holliday junction resolvase)